MYNIIVCYVSLSISIFNSLLTSALKKQKKKKKNLCSEHIYYKYNIFIQMKFS